MDICSICGFEAKNANGLRLHMRRHKGEEPIIKEEIQEEVVGPTKINLFNENTLIVSYLVYGQKEIEKAKNHAEKMGLRMEIHGLNKNS